MDIVNAIMRFECGEMTEDEVVEFFEQLVATGYIYHLQGAYQRMAMRLGLI